MKLLFVICNLEIGGTRRSLLNLLSYISSNYDVDLELLAFSPYGAYKDMVPKKVKLIEGNWLMQGHFSEKKTIGHKYSLLLSRAIGAIGKKLVGENRFWDFILKDFAKKNIGNDYDAVIGFQEGQSDFFTTLTSVKPKMIWIHNDYNNISKRNTRNVEAYADIDHIFFVAETARRSFIKAFPSLEKKMSVIKNIVPQEEIRRKSKENIKVDYYQKGKINIVSVGRIENQKAFDRIVGVLKRLDGLKDKINWIVIGNGSQRKMIERQIIQEKLQDSIRFVGPKTNPYPYIANSDLFVLTSIYESQPMVIMEALTIGIPVVSTNFESAYELLENKKYGVICDNSEEGLAEVLSNIISHPDVLVSLKKETKDFIYNNDAIVNEIFQKIKER